MFSTIFLIVAFILVFVCGFVGVARAQATNEFRSSLAWFLVAFWIVCLCMLLVPLVGGVTLHAL